jgi:hypothetical protein
MGYAWNQIWITFLPYFNSKTDTDSDILEYKCKTDTSDSDLNLDIYSIYRIMFSYFLYW